MLRWLKIHQYRDVAPGTELNFHEGTHVLLGPNGGGKTTLLDLLSMVIRGDFSAAKEEEFDLEFRMEASGETVVARTRHLQRAFDAESSFDQPRAFDDELDVVLTRTGKPSSRHIHASSVSGVLTDFDGTDHVIPGVRITDRSEIWELLLARRQGIFSGTAFAWAGWRLAGSAYRFDEAHAFFDAIHGRANALYPIAEFTAGHWQTPRTGLGAGIVSRWLSGSVVHPFGVQAHNPPRNPQLVVDAATWPVLKTAVDLLGFRDAEFRADLTREIPVGDVIEARYERFSFRFIRRDGRSESSEYLSFGQKRLLAFLIYLEGSLFGPRDAPVLADELVDGMHHRWVEYCLDAMKGRQSFLSSQSPLLMDFLGFTSAEEVQKTFILCDREMRDGRERMAWRNLTTEEGDAFFTAYSVGIQHVSEILRSKGLW